MARKEQRRDKPAGESGQRRQGHPLYADAQRIQLAGHRRVMGSFSQMMHPMRRRARQQPHKGS
jgi:hypothetical protein